MKNRITNIQKHLQSNEDFSTNWDFSKIRVGLKTLEDANFTLNNFARISPRLGDKKTIQIAIDKGDLDSLREISLFFAKTSGIYKRLIEHLSNFYKYDWIVTPYQVSNAVKSKVMIDEFNKVMRYFDNSSIKSFFSEAANRVLKVGCYYGYRVDNQNNFSIQELPIKYCRSRFQIQGKPVVEFCMKYFDDNFKDEAQRARMLQVFPPEFAEGYKKYKQGKLPPEFSGDTAGWYLLNPDNAFKFNLRSDDYPNFISVIPHIIDLDEAQEIDKQRMEQKLLKLIIQKMPLDKNGDLVFDIDEARELHNNAVQMLGKTIGMKVLTTFADIDVADTADKSNATTVDELEKVERTVYNESGTAQNLFNTDGNIALEKSLLDDEASLTSLLLQFQAFLNDALKVFNKNPKKLYFKAEILPTTVYNYKEMSKLYKDHASNGHSKILPLVALGRSQSSIIATAYFENSVLNLNDMLIPPLNSNTMSGNSSSSDGEVGRKEKPDDEKSEKTIANRESMS